MTTPTSSPTGRSRRATATRSQFDALCGALGAPGLAQDPRFSTNAARVANRVALGEALRGLLAARSAVEWAHLLEAAGVPCGPVHSVASALADPQLADGGLVTTATTA